MHSGVFSSTTQALARRWSTPLVVQFLSSTSVTSRIYLHFSPFLTETRTTSVLALPFSCGCGGVLDNAEQAHVTIFGCIGRVRSASGSASGTTSSSILIRIPIAFVIYIEKRETCTDDRKGNKVSVECNPPSAFRT